MNIYRLVVIAAFLLWPHETRSDWEYTTYGMTADQIVTASDGKARKLTSAEQEGNSTSDATAIATSTHQTGQFNFAVTFFADKGSTYLKIVRLRLQTKNEYQTRAQVAELSNALTGKYGQPISNHDEKGQFFTTKQWNWQGDSNNILLKYMDGIDIAWIEYSQRLKDLAL